MEKCVCTCVWCVVFACAKTRFTDVSLFFRSIQSVVISSIPFVCLHWIRFGESKMMERVKEREMEWVNEKTNVWEQKKNVWLCRWWMRNDDVYALQIWLTYAAIAYDMNIKIRLRKLSIQKLNWKAKPDWLKIHGLLRIDSECKMSFSDAIFFALWVDDSWYFHS